MKKIILITIILLLTNCSNYKFDNFDPTTTTLKWIIKNDKLYGRGGADDGYALFSSIAAINALKKQNISLPRILILIEFCEVVPSSPPSI